MTTPATSATKWSSVSPARSRRGTFRPRALHLWLLAAVALASGCADPPPSNYPTQETYLADMTLGPGDTFEVRVFYGGREMTAPYRVNEAGTIAFPYIGTVEVAGKTPSALEEHLRERLADGYLIDPVVSVFLSETSSKRISVYGQVRNPGSFPFSSGMTIVEAISRAGGFTPMARANAVTVTRTAEEAKTNYTVPVEKIGNGAAPNFPMRPGDVIWVPERTF